jgi:hypothetical protein
MGQTIEPFSLEE